MLPQYSISLAKLGLESSPFSEKNPKSINKLKRERNISSKINKRRLVKVRQPSRGRRIYRTVVSQFTALEW